MKSPSASAYDWLPRRRLPEAVVARVAACTPACTYLETGVYPAFVEAQTLTEPGERLEAALKPDGLRLRPKQN
jgi:hypothetical protein